jgi:hydroxymethylglutaryl-CoA lyase
MQQNRTIKLIECPRDAMQGWPHFISTEKKTAYINTLLEVGFDTLDFGSFVSPKAIPQMADTKEVLKGLHLHHSKTKLLAIVANTRGAQEAVLHDEITYLGFPFSISETFQQRNTNSSIAASIGTVQDIQELCIKNDKSLVVYISMGFGNPYGDAYDETIVLQWAEKLAAMNIRIISVADTVGIASPAQVSSVLSKLIPAFPEVEIGVHLHSAPKNRIEKLDAALSAGCIRFDGAIKGIGGCPMAGDELVGNMDTEMMAAHLLQKDFDPELDTAALRKASLLASTVFI